MKEEILEIPKSAGMSANEDNPDAPKGCPNEEVIVLLLSIISPKQIPEGTK
jgi:hypothetical protein